MDKDPIQATEPDTVKAQTNSNGRSIESICAFHHFPDYPECNGSTNPRRNHAKQVPPSLTALIRSDDLHDFLVADPQSIHVLSNASNITMLLVKFDDLPHVIIAMHGYNPDR